MILFVVRAHRSARHASIALGTVLATFAPSTLAAQIPTPTPPKQVSWYGDQSAPNISGVWVRAGSPGTSASKEGWLPWPPPLKPPFATVWQKRLADAAAGKRTDDPVRACLPAGMPRFDTGMTGPMLIMQTPGRVMLYRDGMPVRRIWVDGRPLPKPVDLESFSNGNAIGRYVGSELVTDVAGVKSQPIDSSGIPHSDNLQIVERFQRIDAQTLKVTVTLTDKAAYSHPMTSTVIYRSLNDPHWEPREFLCTPETKYAPEQFVH